MSTAQLALMQDSMVIYKTEDNTFLKIREPKSLDESITISSNHTQSFEILPKEERGKMREKRHVQRNTTTGEEIFMIYPFQVISKTK